jgi:hypothetical protein
MRYLKIQNKGELDIRLVALMGGTTKSTDKFKIGQFGTGLKYTLAYLFRSNLQFKIFVGEDEVNVHTEVENIRGDNFEIICINNNRTSITTKMGEDWEAWMIVRELWCNALDEGGALKDVTTEAIGESGKTTFYIQIDNQIQAVLSNWHKYFIHGQEPMFKNERFAIYPSGDRLCIYKQGVLIYEHKTDKSVFSYDMADADINELREFKGSPSMVITWSLAEADGKTAAYFLENITDEHFEGGPAMDYNWYRSFGEAWKNVLGSGKLIYRKVLDEIIARGNTPDLAALVIVPENLYRFLTKQFAGIGALRVASTIGDFYETYDERTESKINQALAILEHCDYPMHPDLQFVFGFFEDKTTLAKAALDERKIYVSNTFTQKPLFETVAMLIEESEHFNTGMSDQTRAFQQHFINLYTRTLLAKNEVEI